MNQPAIPAGLADMQADFAQSIRTPLLIDQDDYAYQVDHYAAAVVADMLPSERFSGLQRLAIYNQQYWFRLLTILQKEFPLTRRRMGMVTFNRFATAYLDRFPSQHPELHFLWQFIDEFMELEHAWATPAMRQAVALDRIYADVFFAIDQRDFDGRTVSAEQVGALLSRPLPFQSAWYLYQEDWNNVHQRQLALRDPDDERPLVKQRQRGYWAIYRSNQHGIGEESLDALQYRLLTDLHAGQSLTEVCAAIEGEGDEAVIERLGREIGGWFQRWGQLGWFAAVDVR